MSVGERGVRGELTPRVNLRPVGCLDGQLEGEDVTLYRCGTLAHLSEDDARRIRDAFGIEVLIDLRSQREVDWQGRPVALEKAGVSWVHAPIAHHDSAAISGSWPSSRDYARYYATMIDGSSAALITALDLLSTTAGARAAFGCYAGKDRTGIIAAALMEMSGCDRAWITADYVRTNVLLAQDADVMEPNWTKRGLTKAEYLHRIRAQDTTFDELYELLADRDRGIVPALHRRGLRESTVLALRSRMRRQLALTEAPAAKDVSA
jgi:hypothetical protein